MQLDGLRGVAALVVVLNHFTQAVPEATRQAVGLRDLTSLGNWLSIWPWLRFTPARVVVSGQAAVIIFFVLSGFVLALPNRPVRYSVFIGRRFCRVYFPFACVLLAVAAGWALVPHALAPGASQWAANLVAEVGHASLLEHFAMTGSEPGMALNHSMWTLVHEMRVALVLPAMFVAMRAIGPGWVLAGCTVLSAAASVFMVDSVSGSWTATAHFLWLFAAGAAVALRLPLAAGWLAGRSGVVLSAAWVAALLLLAAPFDRVWTDFLLGLGAVAVVSMLLPGGAVADFLASPLPTWLGRVSYSLYLIHLPILLMALALGIPTFALPLVLTATLVGAEITHRCIEQPFHRLARRLPRW